MRYLLLAFSFFLVASVLCHSCKEEVTSARPMLAAADSMMWSNPDSALLVLEQIPDSRELRGEERALYALLLTQARYKSCVLLENDSLIRIAVDYYEGSEEQERLSQAYFYWGMCLCGEGGATEGDRPLFEVAGTDAKERLYIRGDAIHPFGRLL